MADFRGFRNNFDGNATDLSEKCFGKKRLMTVLAVPGAQVIHSPCRSEDKREYSSKFNEYSEYSLENTENQRTTS